MSEQPLLLAGGIVVTMDRDRKIIADGGVAVLADRIVEVGKAEELRANYPNAHVVDLREHVIIPGLIDAHNHPVHYLTKGLLDDIGSKRRWATRLYPFERAVNSDETYWGSMGTFAEMIKSGTTCVGDPGCLHPDAVARAAAEIGLRATITAAVTDIEDALRPFGDNRDCDAATATNVGLFRDWNGAGDGRIKIWFGLWSPTTVSDDLVRHVVRLADEFDTGIHGHLSSSPADNEICMSRHGCRAVERYRRLGALHERFLAAHMGAINDTEVELVAQSGTKIVHCASASMFGAFGCIAHGKFPELIKADVTVALGTDAASISRFLDMVREMYIAACAHKDVRMDAEIMGAHKAMEMATIDGAKALGLQDLVGSLEARKKADIVTLRMNGIEWHPRPSLNPIANLIYSSGGHRVDNVMVDGKFLLRDSRLQTVDEQQLRLAAATAANTSASRAGIVAESVWPVH